MIKVNFIDPFLSIIVTDLNKLVITKQKIYYRFTATGNVRVIGDIYLAFLSLFEFLCFSFISENLYRQVIKYDALTHALHSRSK